MSTLDTESTLAELVTAHPELARRFDDLGLDYCCGGQRRLAEAIEAAGLNAGVVLASLAAGGTDRIPADWAAMAPEQLVDHLELTHHAYLKDALPRLGALADKVLSVHGEHHPELVDVRATFAALRDDLEPHLMKEERILFPMIRQLATATSAPTFHCGTLANPIRVMESEHDLAGELLARLRSLTGGYSVPGDGCASYRALYAGLAEVEADTHLHVHKENNLLFPEVLAAEAALGGGR